MESARWIGVELNQRQLNNLSLYEELLSEAHKVTNFTRVPREQCWARHFLDSLVLVPMIPPGARLLDIGSGAGFPGAVIGIVRSDVKVTCLDSSQRMTSFLEKVFGTTGPLPVLYQVVQNRAELAAHDINFRESFDFVTGRALAPFPIQIELSAGFVSLGGLFVPLRTPQEKKEVESFPAHILGLSLEKVEMVEVPEVLPERMLPVFVKTAHTAKHYPRRWAQMKSKPLGKVPPKSAKV
ncbi:MAG: 16S rRNA (guanine(527)-N(7))-methyltransferase RsmG [Candidatus Caldarchaeum sp.]